MIKPKFYGIKRGRSFIMNDNDKLALGSFLQKFKDGKELEMTVGPKYIKRTQGGADEETNQNGYWWGVIIKIIADEMGEFDTQYVHEQVLIQIGHIKIDRFGEKHADETKDLAKGEFEELCKKARIWANIPKEQGGFGLWIPEPYEVEFGQR